MFKGQDLGQFIKTKLAQEIQKSQIGNFIKQKGAPPITATVKKSKLGEKSKTADGIDMGQQVDAGVIPIIYGHVGMSNTQFDLGQKPSDVDAEFVTQEVRLPVSEGPIAGLSYRHDGDEVRDDLEQNFIYRGEVVDTTEHLKQVVINDSFVVDPTTSVANFKDIKMEMTIGDGTGVYQSATITDYNPLLQEEDGDKIEAITDPTDGKLLNDLGDVTAAKGVNYVLFWNTETGRWEAKSFNALLNETGATYDGGAGGSGGSGGGGGSGGTGGEGGGATADVSKLYTQWNPPPTHTELSDGGTEKVTTTVAEPPSTGSAVVSGKGAPLRRLDQTTPYFTTEIDYADVDSTNDTIDLITFFPDGIYRELTTVKTTVDGTYTLCGTERPITGSGDLNCLTPNVEVAPDGQTATTVTHATGSVTINYVLTTTICGREFILDENSYTISHVKNGGYKHPHKISPLSMNAGAESREDGSPASGVMTGTDCNATTIDDYDFENYDLEDYLSTYPDQILKATNTIKVYAWFDNKTEDGDYTISTNAYLNAVEVTKQMDEFGKYKEGTLTQSAYKLFEPDHAFKKYIADTETDGFDLGDNRKYTQAITGSFGDTGAPDPLVVRDGIESTGSSGDEGSTGSDGVDGSTGSAGTSGTVTVPAVPDVPFAEMSKDSAYSGDGVADTVTLPSSTVTNADALASNTLTISVTKGSVDVVTVHPSVSAIGRNTSALTLIGTAANLQTTLDSGLKFYSTTATTGDVTITHYISSSEGNSRTTRTIRPQAVTNYEAPSFTIVVDDYVGTFDAYVRGKAIMNSITGATSNNATATLIAEAITSYSSIPNWTATSNLNAVTVTGPVGLGNSYNGIQPTYTGTMDATITEIADGVSPSRISQPKQSTKELKGKFIPAIAFTNTLDADDVAWFQVKYRPEQGDGEATLSEIGLYVGGRMIQEPSSTIRGEDVDPDSVITFEIWKAAGYTSQLGWTGNAAWIFFDYLTNTRYGLGNDIILDDVQKEQLYKDIYTASMWCGHKPISGDLRAKSFHGIFYGAESKFEALQKIADTFFAKFVYLNGNPRLVFDSNAFVWTYESYTHAPTIKKLVNQTNAADLIYQGGSIDNIFNVINVKFNNPVNYFRTEEVQYKNSASITKHGERETTIELTGCTSKQQALWHGAWMYETEAANSETVTYIAGWDHYDVLPGDLIHINDGLRVDSTTVGGRVASVDGDTLTLDRDAGTGSISLVDSTGAIRTGTVSGTTATMSGGHTYVVGAVFNVHSGSLAANYRVIAIEESEDGIYAVTAQKHDPDKYTRIWANTV